MYRSCSVAFFAACVLLCIAAAANAIDINKPCEEGKQWKDKCHTCYCSLGKPVCTRELCEEEAAVTPVLPTPLSAATTQKTTASSGLSLHSSISWFGTALAIAITFFSSQ